MQIWKWLLVIGLLFLITYNPSSRTFEKYIESDPEIMLAQSSQDGPGATPRAT